MLIGVIDYGMGNVASVVKALGALRLESKIVQQPAGLDTLDAIVLPGVGAFAQGMSNLHERGLVDAMTRRVLSDGLPFLGICLGMHLLATTGYEPVKTPGLGWLDAGLVTARNRCVQERATRI